jgi:hypothetical protein
MASDAPKDIDVFQRLPVNVLRPWLEKERLDAYRNLSQGTDSVTLYRAQGKVIFVESMLKLLDVSKAR